MENTKQPPSKTRQSKSSTPRGKRKAVCSSCRHRRSKCDGRLPKCATCVAYNSQCVYDKAPSLAYVRSLEARIEQLVQAASSASPVKSDIGSNNEADEILENLSPPSPPITASFEQRGQPPDDFRVSPSNQTADGDGDTRGKCDHWVSEISVDGEGRVCYHNPTSAIHEAPLSDQRSNYGASFSPYSPQASSTVDPPTPHFSSETKQALIANAATQRHMEDLSLESINQGGISNDLARELLKLHWCWMHPMYLIVYRPAFTRDMALAKTGHNDTPYFSETLMKVILAHCSRFLVKSAYDQVSADKLRNELTQQSYYSLCHNLMNPSSIPTIQALLQQSGREIAAGRSSQAWLYSGMAFRMAIDLGIHLPGDKLQTYMRTLTAEDVEIRKRLFWSCYTFDKTISLYQGRMPAFIPPIQFHEPVFMDDFSENELWEPYYGSAARDPARTTEYYPPTKGHLISCFTALCRLSIILSATMLEIYGSSSATADASSTTETSTKNPAFVRISKQLRAWWNRLSDHLRLEVNGLPDLSPPPHIVSLNLLYHANLILLHRPFILSTTDFSNPAVSRSNHICMLAAASIGDLIHLLTKTFGYSHITYLNCYSVYIAATIAVLHIGRKEEYDMTSKSSPIEDKVDLKYLLDILQTCAVGMPALRRSVDIIKIQMQKIVDRRSRKYMEELFPSSRSRGFADSSQSSLLQVDSQHNQAIISDNDITSGIENGAFDSDSGFYVEGLPAFLGPNLNISTDYAFDTEITDPMAREALIGLTLDPHLTLDHGTGEWDFEGFLRDDGV